jgi:hypothetical protein
MSRKLMGAVVTTALLGFVAPAFAASASKDEIKELKAEIQKQESIIQKLEHRVDELEQQAAGSPAPVPEAAASTNTVQSNDNAFNPAISAVINGHYAAFTGHDTPVAGFASGDESRRPSQGLAIDEAEINLSSNVDDKFFAAVTASASEENGETSLDLEEAYAKTLGLPNGLGLKMGRFLEPIGYINDHHEHTDDFADRPLPNRVFLNNSYKDDGLLATWILPTEFYAETGIAALRAGGDFPTGGDHDSHPGAWLAYGRTGGDIGENQSWLASLSTVQARPRERTSNEDAVTFSGNSDLYAASLRYVWDPTGNSKQQEVTLQGEYFWRHENGTYNDAVAGTGDVNFDGNQSGWYAQGVYRFAPQWRVGARYSMVNPSDVPAGLANSALDSHGHDPWNAAVMGDWTNSEFSRFRLQFGHEEPAQGQTDNQVILQYIMAIGPHPAHTF